MSVFTNLPGTTTHLHQTDSALLLFGCQLMAEHLMKLTSKVERMLELEVISTHFALLKTRSSAHLTTVASRLSTLSISKQELKHLPLKHDLFCLMSLGDIHPLILGEAHIAFAESYTILPQNCLE